MATRSMLVLGGWAMSNLLTGGIGLTQVPEGSEAGRFHQMNIAWNAVNLGIAIPAYIGGRKRMRSPIEMDLQATLEAERRTEQLYLINFGLDLAYIGAGAWMREHGRRPVNDPDLWLGFGTSLAVQGGFLLLFDGVNFLLHSRHGHRNAGSLWGHANVQPRPKARTSP